MIIDICVKPKGQWRAPATLFNRTNIQRQYIKKWNSTRRTCPILTWSKWTNPNDQEENYAPEVFRSSFQKQIFRSEFHGNTEQEHIGKIHNINLWIHSWTRRVIFPNTGPCLFFPPKWDKADFQTWARLHQCWQHSNSDVNTEIGYGSQIKKMDGIHTSQVEYKWIIELKKVCKQQSIRFKSCKSSPIFTRYFGTFSQDVVWLKTSVINLNASLQTSFALY